MKSNKLIVAVLLLCSMQNCKKFVEVESPSTGINSANIFENDATAAATLTGIYTQMAVDSKGMSGFSAINVFPGLSADELSLYSGSLDETRNAYYTNALSSTVSDANLWNRPYSYIYDANAAIEGLTKTTTLTAQVKNQLLGEAHFVRAFSYFYLTNLFGGVPLVINTDYSVNAGLTRATGSQVMEQVVSDLKIAQGLLDTRYLTSDALTPYASGQEERVRPNRYVADALLARTLLYTQDYVNAETLATSVIDNQTIYDTVALDDVFLKNSKETIWAIQPVGGTTQSNTGEGSYFIPNTPEFPSTSYAVFMNQNFIDAFEAGDNRMTDWLAGVTTGGITYYYPYKYKIGLVNSPTMEYSVVMRLAELYLIRAEARVQQNDLAGSLSDLNIIRSRAGLPNSIASTQAELLTAILKERRIELFSEWGHRWLDLKRSGSIDAVMNIITPLKGGTWNGTWALYPIPFTELQFAPGLVQNPGYN